VNLGVAGLEAGRGAALAPLFLEPHVEHPISIFY